MVRKERSYRTSNGEERVLLSERTVSEDSSNWLITLTLYSPGRFRRKQLARRTFVKSEEWSTRAVLLLQAHEEALMLSAADIDVSIFDLI